MSPSYQFCLAPGETASADRFVCLSATAVQSYIGMAKQKLVVVVVPATNERGANQSHHHRHLRPPHLPEPTARGRGLVGAMLTLEHQQGETHQQPHQSVGRLFKLAGGADQDDFFVAPKRPGKLPGFVTCDA